jgi:uncharacterized FlaG/YvyC family protein
MSEEQTDAIGSMGALSSTEFNSVPDHTTPVASPKTAPPIARGSGTPGSPARQPTAQDITTAVSQANANLSNYGRVVAYGVDAATGISIATIRDSHTGAVLQQFPGTDMLHLAQLLAEWSPGKKLQVDLLA